ncbi:MAG: GldG family protein [Oligoflexus sp.]
MKSSLIALPFLALFLGVIGLASYSSLPTVRWLAFLLWGLGAALLTSWAVMERQGLKEIFSRKGARYGASSGLSFVLGLLLIVGIAFLSTRPRFDLSWDVTEDRLNTLSDQSLKIVDKMKQDKVEVDVLGFFVNPEKKQSFADLLALYQHAGAPIQLKYIDPQAEPNLAIAENVTTADTVIVKSGSQESRLTNFTEEKMTNALLRVLKTENKTLYFTSGHGERDLNSSEAEGFGMAKAELESERYDIDTITLLESEAVPENVDLLIIAGPKYDFRPEEINVLRRYLDEARPLLVLVDALVPLPNLKALLEDYGLSIQNDMVAINPNNPLSSQPDWQYSALATEFDEFSPVTRDFVSQGKIALLMPFSRSIDVVEGNKKGLRPTILARGSEMNVTYSEVSQPEDLRELRQDQVLPGDVGLLAYSVGQVGGSELAKKNNSNNSSKETELDTKKGTDAKANKELRLVVSGSSHFASNYGAQRPENMDMFLNLTNYLLQDEDFISIRPRESSESRLDLATSSSQFNLLFFSFIYPFFFLGYGIVHWLKRRRS